jgi:5-formyltetrahydrofolate cyclo-ligase
VHVSKESLRPQLLAARRALDAGAREALARALCERVLALTEVAGARCVAAYVSVGSEPGTAPLCAALRARGVRVLLPRLRTDLDLDWSDYSGPDALRPAVRGLREPTAPRLGPDALTAADAVVVPALAVDRRGARLGRGGGSYDRALARVPAGRLVVALLHDGELVAAVPEEPHDRRVTAAVTASRTLRFPLPLPAPAPSHR